MLRSLVGSEMCIRDRQWSSCDEQHMMLISDRIDGASQSGALFYEFCSEERRMLEDLAQEAAARLEAKSKRDRALVQAREFFELVAPAAPELNLVSQMAATEGPVSYTHLTLPTKRIV
eukprot:TRINITY_DN33144_c0_g1_i1.p2 TRINITY_DN33144_c0_g1~~TRINITY_DN33144_c0_g1_i1.p2  ORF type:complete len:118 (-),score=31.14 TRINITY_DN33144_c0_g1_i1:40-393(-)